MKKTIIVLGLALALVLGSFFISYAQTTDQSALIAALEQIVLQLQQQLAQLLAARGLGTTGTPPQLQVTLRLGMEHPQVKQLQQWLNFESIKVANVGPGSPGQETFRFGPATLLAVNRFQQKYASEILVPNGLTKPSGVVGRATWNKLAQLYWKPVSSGGGGGVSAPQGEVLGATFKASAPTKRHRSSGGGSSGGGGNTNPDDTEVFITSTFALNAQAGLGGTLAKSPNQLSYDRDASVTLTATPNAGYQFTGWSGNATSTQNPLTVVMDADKTITANFSLVACTPTWTCPETWSTCTSETQTRTCTSSNCGTQSRVETQSCQVESATFTVTPTVSSGGTISPNMVQTVNPGTDITFSVDANPGYELTQLLVDGTPVALADYYTFVNVQENRTIGATFSSLAVASPGTVVRSGSSGTVLRNATVNITLTVTPEAGDTFYAIDETIPAGWTVTSAGGGDTTQAGHLKWVKEKDAVTTTYTYTLRAPSLPGTGTFSGQYMFEGDTAEKIISGLSSITVN